MLVERHRMIVEGFKCKKVNLEDCSTFMTDLVKCLGTREIGRMQFEITVEFHDAKLGITVDVEYLESGSQLRTWPEDEFVTLDIFSCKFFRKDAVLALFEIVFEPKTLEMK